MKLHYLLFSCLLLCLPLARAQKTMAAFERIQDRERDGKPSRCDCDYHRTRLELLDDSSFLLQEVRGRLDPQVLLSESGTWNIVNDTLLVLEVPASDKSPGHAYRFVIGPQGLCRFDECLSGNTLALRPRRKKD